MKAGTTATEDLIERVGLSPVQASLEAVKSMNGLGDKNWVKILEDTAMNYDAGAKLEKFGKRLQQGDNVDWAAIKTISHNAMENTGGDFISLSEIEAGEVPFKETGFTAIDEHLGGLPIVGQVIVAAPPGTGKTTFMTGLASCWVKKNPMDSVAIFTLEMMKAEIKLRFNETSNLSIEEQGRIQINDAIISPEEVVSKASTIENLGLVCIDFADLLIKGETTESTMAHIYRTFMLGAKQLGCPVVLLSQLNRGYSGGIPRPNDIRYTGLAEALAWMILMLYNPSTDWFGEEDTQNNKNNKNLPIREGTSYIICWKSRGGFRKHKDDSPGAIQLQFKGERGWRTNDAGRWFSLRKL
jgi:replicative DNA helicase